MQCDMSELKYIDINMISMTLLFQIQEHFYGRKMIVILYIQERRWNDEQIL